MGNQLEQVRYEVQHRRESNPEKWVVDWVFVDLAEATAFLNRESKSWPGYPHRLVEVKLEELDRTSLGDTNA